MNTPAPITVALRIPGKWSHPRELIQRLPAGCRLTAEALILPDMTQVEFGAMAADDQFGRIFRSSCREPATAAELATVDGYAVNIILKGPGGSMEAARTMMRAGAAVVRAGGAGVFIDNSVLAHGGGHWLEMTEDLGPDALSFAFVAIVRGKADVWTMGMHVLGLRDVAMKRADIEAEGFDIDQTISLDHSTSAGPQAPPPMKVRVVVARGNNTALRAEGVEDIAVAGGTHNGTVGHGPRATELPGLDVMGVLLQVVEQLPAAGTIAVLPKPSQILRGARKLAGHHAALPDGEAGSCLHSARR
jgi:hypothetical protein